MFLATSAVNVTQTVLIIILLVLGILTCLYTLVTFKRMSVAAKKVDYFFEDLTYKSELLNSTVDTISRMNNYIDIFEAFSKRNLKSWVKVAVKNKDIVYKLVNKLRDFANSED